ncbi:MAG: hypothetical protein CVT66_02560 [Actinobacteria bacterium HGW-Actinobacteria-6]|nr:MAG: hypothetical protein CVT66_02560 [Actinobacteria bacterium HGW-Actinobacteria-6]
MSQPGPGTTVSEYLLEGVASIISAAAVAALFGLGSQWALNAISGTQGLQDIARMLVGGLLGLIVGAPLGPWAVARFSSQPYSRMRGWAGAVLGAVTAMAIIAATSAMGAASFSGWIALTMVVIGAVTFGNLRRKSA